ncbi:CAP domain-containing protein [Bradyrhizobium sp.]|uniref:CAP domain-containing protein n=1 Tax=Bradyrhizobium sp. TaxID=376 RepID=UPI003FA598A5
MAGRKTVVVRQALLLGLLICLGAIAGSRIAAANPAQLISDFRLKHGEKRVTLDTTLTRIAHDQAQAMATKDQLDHNVLGNFNSRMSPANAGRAAENIAYGYESFPKTLDQWINSSGHRKNLLLPGATRVGVASVKSAKTGRTYWAMVIAGDYERPKPKAPPQSSKEIRQAKAAKPKSHAAESCRLKILSLCF